MSATDWFGLPGNCTLMRAGLEICVLHCPSQDTTSDPGRFVIVYEELKDFPSSGQAYLGASQQKTVIVEKGSVMLFWAGHLHR